MKLGIYGYSLAYNQDLKPQSLSILGLALDHDESRRFTSAFLFQREERLRALFVAAELKKRLKIFWGQGRQYTKQSAMHNTVEQVLLWLQ
jgi:hypothetical protein